MRVSVKGRYALASMITIAENFRGGQYESIVNISGRLGISKIYLEQVFALLKKAELVKAVKGAQGGYILTRSPDKITAYDILYATESSLFEPAEETVPKTAPEIEISVKSLVFEKLDKSIAEHLKNITLDDLLLEAKRNKKGQELMFYI